MIKLNPLDNLCTFYWNDDGDNGSADGFGGGQTGDGDDEVGDGGISDGDFGSGGYTSSVDFGGQTYNDATSVSQVTNPAHLEFAMGMQGLSNDGGVFGDFSSTDFGKEFDGTTFSIDTPTEVETFNMENMRSTFNHNTKSSIDLAFDSLELVNLVDPTTLSFGTIAAHLVRSGTSINTAIEVEAVVKIGLGLLTSGISLQSVLAAIDIATTTLAGIGAVSASTYNSVNLGIEIVNILYTGYQMSLLASLTKTPTLGFISIGYVGYEFLQLGSTGSSEVDLDNIMADDGSSGIYSELYDTYSDSVYYYGSSGLSNSIQFNNNITSSQIQPVLPTVYKYEDNQEDDKMQITYQEYKGGINEVSAPHMIAPNEGQIFTNITTISGTLKSEKLGSYLDILYRYKYILDSTHIFLTNNYFNIAKMGNFFYVTIEGRNKVGRLDLTNDIVYDTDILDIDILAPTSVPTCKNIVDLDTYTVTASLINILDENGQEETYTASVTSDYNSDIEAALVNNIPLVISGTCSTGTPDGRTIAILVNGKEFTTVSYNETFTLSILDQSFLNAQLDRELWDEYQYAYTYYNEESGYESIPIFTDSWLRKGNSIEVSNIMLPSDTSVTKIYLYRIGGYSTVYRRITEIENDFSATTTSYIDVVADMLTYSVLDTDNIADIEDLTGLIEHRGSLLAFKNNQVYFSKPGKPNVWSEFQSVRVGGVVKSIASVPLGVLILTDNQKSYILSGTDKTNYSLSAINNTVGIVSNKSMNYLQNSALWLGYEGLMTSVGSAIQNLSRNQVRFDDIGTITFSFSYDNIYYLCGENYMMTVDFNSAKPAFKKVSIANITSIFINEGKLCYIVAGKEYTDFGVAGDSMELHYRSPNFIGGSYDILKEFNKINLTYVGSFTYNVIIDDVVVLTKYLESTKVMVEEIQIPSEFNEGLYISLELIGTGEILNFRYLFSYLNNN